MGAYSVGGGIIGDSLFDHDAFRVEAIGRVRRTYRLYALDEGDAAGAFAFVRPRGSRSLSVYQDDRRTDAILTVRKRAFRAVRDVRTPDEGLIGGVKLSMRGPWRVLDRESGCVARVHEDTVARASRRRRNRIIAAASVVTVLLALGEPGRARPSRMVIVVGSAEVGRMWRREVREGELELAGDPGRTLDRRVAAALLLLFVAGRGG